MREQIDEVLQFWFGDIVDGFPLADRNSLWWNGDETTDQQIEQLFGHRVRQALKGELQAWKETPRGRLALVILLDQFTRNIYRGTAEAFSGDAQALAIVQDSLLQGYDAALEYSERLFLYIPLEHAESLDIQEQCVACMTELKNEVPLHKRALIETVIDFAILHRDVIERFGRFPHRNEVLGRESSEEELAYLCQSHNRWGQ